MKKTKLHACLALFLALTSCNESANTDNTSLMVKSETVATDMSQVRTAIEKIENDWAAALNKKDINALIALYADDAISMQNDGPSLKGKAAIREQQEKTLPLRQGMHPSPFKHKTFMAQRMK